ncbi:glycosyltransferase [Sphingomonas limnosediminicola]
MENQRSVLAIVVPDLYHASVTFFHAHIASIWPGRTVVIHLSSTGEPARTDVPVLEIPAARPWPVPPRFFLSKIVVQVNAWRANRLNRRERAQVEKFIKEHGVTHLFAEFASSGVVIAPVARKLGLPLTVMSHGWDINVIGQMPQWRLRYRSLFHSDAKLIAVCAFLRDRMRAIGAPVERIEILPCAVDAASFRLADQNASGPARVVMVSRLTEQKGPLFSIAAFARAAKQHSNLLLDIVGNGPLMPQVCQAIKEAGLEDRVILHGDVDHPSALAIMSRCHIFLQHCVKLPKQGIESQAVSLLEAMGHGLVPIVTRHGGMEDHVLDGVRGWLVDERDVDTMSSRIIEMTEKHDLRRKLGCAAREFVLSNFSGDVVYPRLRGLIGLEA